MMASSASIPAALSEVDWRRLQPLLQAFGPRARINLNIVGSPFLEEPQTKARGVQTPAAEPRSDPVQLAREQLLGRLGQGKDRVHVTGMSDILALRLAKLFATAPENIRSGLGIYSGYRSNERQAQLYQEALRRYGSEAEARRWVAPPGRSRHNHGEAADLAYNGASLRHAPADVVNWLHANAGRFGLAFPLRNENWHIEPIESRRGR